MVNKRLRGGSPASRRVMSFVDSSAKASVLSDTGAYKSECASQPFYETTGGGRRGRSRRGRSRRGRSRRGRSRRRRTQRRRSHRRSRN